MPSSKGVRSCWRTLHPAHRELACIMGASFLFATPFGIADMKGERDKQRQTAKRLGLEARLDDIKDIYRGDFNGDGDQDYQVLYADGTIQLYLHKGHTGPVAPDSAETYLKQAPN